MKKIIALLSVASLLAAVATTTGCMRQAEPEALSTENAITEVMADITEQVEEEDLALPQVNTNTTVAEYVVPSSIPHVVHIPKVTQAPTTTTTQPTTVEQEETPAEGEAPAPEATTTTTTAPTTTQAPKGNPDLLNSAVLSKINSGTYTMTLSKCFGTAKSTNDDKVVKYVSGGQTAYMLSSPDAKYNVRVFSQNGLYYAATDTLYCTLTADEYQKLCKDMDSVFLNFAGLDYQSTEEGWDGLTKYTKEKFNGGNTTIVLWYKSNALDRLQMLAADGSEISFPMAVTGTVDQNAFSLGATLTESTYETMKPFTDAIHVAFGE